MNSPKKGSKSRHYSLLRGMVGLSTWHIDELPTHLQLITCAVCQFALVECLTSFLGTIVGVIWIHSLFRGFLIIFIGNGRECLGHRHPKIMTV